MGKVGTEFKDLIGETTDLNPLPRGGLGLRPKLPRELKYTRDVKPHSIVFSFVTTLYTVGKEKSTNSPSQSVINKHPNPGTGIRDCGSVNLV